MGKFNRGGSRSGGGFGGGRRDGGRSEMFSAVCDACGKACQVPFRPTGNKPVYCSDCFSKQEGNDRGDRSSRFAGDRGRGDRRERPRREDRQMFDTICEKCGKACQVPFKPTPGKPIFCDDCFSKDGGSRGGRGGQDLSEITSQLKKMAEKIDLLVELLGNKALAKKTSKKEEVVEEKKKNKKVAKTKIVAAKSKSKASPKKKAVAKKKK